MNQFVWGVYPYLCVLSFLVVPLVRMAYRPFAWSTRASGLFGRRVLGAAALLLHWGLFLILLGHLAGLFGGLWGAESWLRFFYWTALIGGFMVLAAAIVALGRRFIVPEVRAMSQIDDYVVHVFLIAIVGLALYQVLVHRIFGVAYPAASWVASLWTLTPQPELMASASAISKWHVFLALTFFGYFPFTKLVHFWTYPINFFVRPRQSMRTQRFRFQRQWDLGGRSDKSWLVYGLVSVILVFLLAGRMLGGATASAAVANGASRSLQQVAAAANGRLAGWPLYVSQCARCHGVEGRGDGLGAASPTFAAPPRDLTTGPYKFISTNNSVASDADLTMRLRHGLPAAGMPAFAELSDAQVQSLVAVVATLWKDRPEPGTTIVVPPAPAASDALLAKGAGLYAANCAPCHGASGRGDGPAAAILTPRPRDFTARALKAGDRPEDIYLRASAGIPPTMPPFGALPSEDIWAIVRHIERAYLGR